MPVQIDLSSTNGNQTTLTTNYTEQATTLIAPAGRVVTNGNPDNNHVDTLTLVIDGATATESLSLDVTGQLTAALAGINANYNSGTGTLTLSGSEELTATWTTILRHVVYENTSDAPRTSGVTIGITALNTANNASGTGTVTMNVSTVNDSAPVASGSATLAAINEDTANPPGATVSSLFSGNFSDTVDGDTLGGIAISGYTVDASKGNWQYSTNSGSTWTTLASTTTTSAAALHATDLLRFVPASNYNGSATALSANLIESGQPPFTSGSTLDLTGATGGLTHISSATVALGETITAVNDAPLATGSATLSPIVENTANPAGATVSSLFSGNFSDATDQVSGGSSASALTGIAISSHTADGAKGSWQYSTDGGGNWVTLGSATTTSSILLNGTDLMRFVPTASFSGSATALSANLIESGQAAFTSGSTLDLTGVTGAATHISSAAVALSETIQDAHGVIDGNLSEWTSADRLDLPSTGTAGYALYGHFDGSTYTFAIQAPDGVPIGSGTTIWLDTDFSTATGYHLFGTTGVEYVVSFDASGNPALYSLDPSTGAQTLVSPVSFAFNGDKTAVELALPAAALGTSADTIGVYALVNNSTALPGDFGTEYFLVNSSTLPADTSTGHRIAIVYSDTTANVFYGLPDANVNKTGYSQVFMASQYQAMQAGVPFDVISESDLMDLSRIAQYDALVFPSFTNVHAADVSTIQQNLILASQKYDVAMITGGLFMTNDETGAALAGDPYATMRLLFDLAPDGFGTGNLSFAAASGSPIMEDYAAGEIITGYTNFPYINFTTPDFAPYTVLANVVVGGTVIDNIVTGGTSYNGAVETHTSIGGTNVVYSTPYFMSANNMLGHVIEDAVYGSGLHVRLQETRSEMIVASRTDMDQAMFLEDVSGGIYAQMLPILQQWQAQYNFVGSYFIDVGDQTDGVTDPQTNWAVSLPYYLSILALGNEIGSHSLTHEFYLASENSSLWSITGTGPGTIDYEFNGSRQIIQQHIGAAVPGYVVEGAAVPGANELLPWAQAMGQYYKYLTGGWTGIDNGAPGAFGYMTPDDQDFVYFAPNMTFDFTEFGFHNLSALQVDAVWATQTAQLTAHGSAPILVWPWHDYGLTDWPGAAEGEYEAWVFTNMIERAYNAGAEFVTMGDLADRVNTFHGASFSTAVSGNTITATVTPAAGGDLGTFALPVDFDSAGQVIQNVGNWYAYNADKVFLPANGGTFTINVGTTQDDLTHISALSMRADLQSVTGDGKNLGFSFIGDNIVTVTIHTQGADQLMINGTDSATLSGNTLNLGFTNLALHNVALTEALSVTGTAGNDFIFGTAGNDSFTGGGGGNDHIDGRGGIDKVSFTGNRASYTITVNSGIATVVDNRAGSPDGTDTIANATYLEFADGFYNADGTPASFNGTNGDDLLVGTPGNDTINGLDGNDTINGGAGNDSLDGGTGADIMSGGTGDDTYYVDNAADQVIEAAGEGHDVVFASVDYALAPGQEVEELVASASGLTLTGNDQANYLTGSAGVDTLNGGAGNDFLDGGAGADTLQGGTGDDTYFVDDAGDQVVEVGGGGLDLVYAMSDYVLGAGQSVEYLVAFGTAGLTLTGNDLANILIGGAGDDTLNGEGGNDELKGGAGSDTLNGGIGNDRLNGGTGADEMTGGTGNDTYDVDNAGDEVVEAGGEGSDAVYTTVSYTLGAGQSVEYLSASGTVVGGLILTGNDLANILTGGGGDDTLNGEGGNDELKGGAGSDTLNGGTGNDRLNGGAGADLLQGGTGNDTYDVDNGGDQIVEAGGAGSDTVYASVDYVLGGGQEVEYLVVAGTAGLALTGNDLTNKLIGGVSADTLNGEGGNDWLDGGAGADTLRGGGGTDRLDGGAGADTLEGGTGNDTYLVDDAGDQVIEAGGEGSDIIYATANYTLGDGQAVEYLSVSGTVAGGLTLTGNELANYLTGGAGADTLNGGGGTDRLDGGAGADTLQGGTGNDTYLVDNAGDQVIEAGGEGSDIVYATANYALGDGQAVEYLSVSGTMATGLTLTGNELANSLTGGAGADTLNGGAGNDKLNGGAGNDTLNGGTGNDTFVFGLASGDDVVQDFQAGSDRLDIRAWSVSSFGALMASASESDGNTTITLSPTDTIHLSGVHMSQLHSGDFIL